ncbi:tetratricopeptide repeat protein [Derxia gummosa]|uniref:Tetratricopeptide repeat protein n=1 Tax=Derxia gummosa DSM 723 TaxID=1121388 RepID=A0A8B6X8D6_9BURK|nr:SEL1-like repeat protein [Derxia gummosa]
MPPIPARALLAGTALLAALLPVPARAERFCGQPRMQLDANGEPITSDLGIEAALARPASMQVCASGYFAEKCGDHESAHLIYDKCIAAGYAGAMIWKALLLEQGIGVAPDPARATALLRQAAESGSDGYATVAKVHYASALQLGRGVARDEAAAREWFRRAADEGDPDAAEFLRTGHHTAERDVTGRGFGVATEAVEGQRLAPVARPAGMPLAPTAAMLAALVAVAGAGAWWQARRGARAAAGGGSRGAAGGGAGGGGTRNGDAREVRA